MVDTLELWVASLNLYQNYALTVPILKTGDFESALAIHPQAPLARARFLRRRVGSTSDTPGLAGLSRFALRGIIWFRFTVELFAHGGTKMRALTSDKFGESMIDSEFVCLVSGRKRHGQKRCVTQKRRKVPKPSHPGCGMGARRKRRWTS